MVRLVFGLVGVLYVFVFVSWVGFGWMGWDRWDGMLWVMRVECNSQSFFFLLFYRSLFVRAVSGLCLFKDTGG